MIPENQELNRMLDFVKKEIFLNKNAAFLGSIMCSLDFQWDRDGAMKNMVATDGVRIIWGVEDFLRCSFKERCSTLLHELWHVALLHNLRCGGRDKLIWNIACDYRINNNLRRDGETVPDTWVVDPKLDWNGILAEEQIYDLLLQNQPPMPSRGDLLYDGQPNPTQQLSSVVRAAQAAQMAGQMSQLPGNFKEILDSFLAPKIPWRQELSQWMTELIDSEEYTWKRPNRRYPDIYMPSRDRQESRLEHLVYFLDVSGSITTNQARRFNSEIKYVKEVLNPEKLTLIQFDDRITQIQELKEDDPFESIEIVGRGGTSLHEVHRWIENHQPTAAIIFSDLYCDQMKPLTVPVPILWVVINNPTAKVGFGKMIHITED